MAFRMLPVRNPCTESFAEMPGDEKTRYCAKCNEHVHDLSAGTEAEARELFRAAGGGRLCVRFVRDAKGAVRFGVSLAAALSLASCSAAPLEPQTEVEALDREMGDGVPDQDDRCPTDDDPDASGQGCPDLDAGPDATPPSK